MLQIQIRSRGKKTPIFHVMAATQHRNQFSQPIDMTAYVKDLLENRSDVVWDQHRKIACRKGKGAGFAYNSSGYARVNIDGKKVVAHALVLAAYSKTPRPENTDASHLCGNAWCFAPKHLVWEDRATNISRRGCAGFALVTVLDVTKWIKICKHQPTCKITSTGIECDDNISPSQ